MTVELVWITPDAEKLISYCARVSNPDNQENPDYEKLLGYCVKHNHWSIFEMANCCIEINTSRGIAAQILRHRSFTFQEFCISGDSLITTILPTTKKPSYISIKSLYDKQNWKSYKNILVRTYNSDTKRFETSKIREVFYTGKKECYKIKTFDGKEITCTKEHKLYTQDGFKSLEDIVGLKLNNLTATMSKQAFIAVNGVPLHQSKEWMQNQRFTKPRLSLSQIAKNAAVSKHTIKKWLKKFNLQFSKKEVAEYTPIWNKNKFGYKIKPRTQKQKEHMKSITPTGKDHHAYKGGMASERKAIANYFNGYRKAIFEKYNFICQLCKRNFKDIDGKIHLHHVKEVSLYPELAKNIDNVIPVHAECHMKYHGKTYNYKEIRSKHKGNTLSVKFVKIESIEYIGFIDTYDLETESNNHNYIANKILVHNSQRYAKVSSIEDVIPRRQDTKNRQNSIDDLSEDTKKWFAEQKEIIYNNSMAVYNEAIEKGIAKECARFLLPLSTSTKLYMNGTIRSWIHYITLRSSNGTQKEHMDIAIAIKELLKPKIPTIAKALGW